MSTQDNDNDDTKTRVHVTLHILFVAIIAFMTVVYTKQSYELGYAESKAGQESRYKHVEKVVTESKVERPKDPTDLSELY